MAKTVEEIKAEVEALVKSQGNQGAISLGTVLDDITELAGEGGGGDALPKIVIKNPSGTNIIIDATADTKAIYDKCYEYGITTFAVEVDMTDAAGLANILLTVPTVARAIPAEDNAAISVFAVILPVSGAQIIADIFTIKFLDDGTVVANATQYVYTIGA